MSDTPSREVTTTTSISQKTTDEWLRLALSAARMGTWAWDILTGEIKWSDNLEEIHGMAPGTFDGTFNAYLHVLHPEDRASFQHAVREAIENRTEFSAEFRILWPDGTVHWIMGKGQAFYDETGQPERMVGLGMDITDRIQASEALRKSNEVLRDKEQAIQQSHERQKEADRQLRQSETRFRMLVDQAPLSIQVLGPDGRTLRVNGAWERLWGVTLDDIGDYNMLQDQQLVDKGIMPFIRKAFAGEAVAIPPVLYDPDQTLPDRTKNRNPQRWTQAFMYPVKDEAGRIREVVIIHEDITEQRLAEKERAHLAAIVSSSDDAIVSKDLNGIVTSWNPAAERIYGYSAEEIVGKSKSVVIPPDLPDELPTILRKIKAGERIEHYDTVRLRKDGVRVNLSVTISPIRDPAGKIVGASTIARDATERIRYLREIETLNARLQRSVQETHHRVKNNLQVICALAELQTDEGNTTVPIGAMHRIGQHTRSLAAIHDLLTQQAKSDAHTDTVSTRAVMGKLIPLLQATSGERRIHAETDDVRLPVRAGASLALLVSEIASNSVKHGKGDITVFFQVDGDRARLEICDAGPGFPPGFEWRNAASTGLGLIDSAGRYDLRGDISFTNRESGGAKVVVTFSLSKLQPD